MKHKAAFVLLCWPFCTEANDHAFLIEKAQVVFVSINYFVSFVV